MPIANSRFVLTPDEIAAIRALIAREGEVRACELLGISRQAQARLLAGLDVRAGNIALARMGLSQLTRVA